MRLSDLLRFSVDNLRRRKGRTVLTIIGVVVGVCAIIVMISLGIAVNQATDQLLQGWGDLTKITVQRWGAQQGTPDLDDDMVDVFRQIEHVNASTPLYQPYSIYGDMAAGNNDRYMGWASLIGMEIDAIPAMGYTLMTGSYLTDQNLGRDKIPVMIGSQAIFNFYDTRVSMNNPNRYKYPEYDYEAGGMSASVPINIPRYDENCTLLNPEDVFFDIMNTKLTYKMNIGYDENTGEPITKDYELVPMGMLDDGGTYEIANGIIMSIDDVEQLESDYNRATGNSGGGGGMIVYGPMGGSGDTVEVGGYDQVYVKVDSVDNMPQVEKAIRDIGYQIYSMSSTREDLMGQAAQTQMMLGGLAAVSLLVAALNIMNTMTMAIYERTKEIGVMKVLGCKLGNIRQQFLIESGAIGFLGGLLGVALSVLLSLALNYLPQLLGGSIDIAAMFGLGGLMQSMGPDMRLSVIPFWLILGALAFATVVGVLSGIAPANRAVKISSLEAIRHE